MKNLKPQPALLLCCLAGCISLFFITAPNGSSASAATVLPTPPTASGPIAKTDDKTPNKAFRGVVIGMLADELRKKLGTPKETDDKQDFYIFSDTESAQVFYDASHTVMAISIDFNGKAATPAPKDVLGEDVTASADGAIYKMIRFPKEGYWISYSRTSGSDPLTSITMQRIPDAKPAN